MSSDTREISMHVHSSIRAGAAITLASLLSTAALCGPVSPATAAGPAQAAPEAAWRTCHGRPATIVGTGRGRIVGTPGPDVIVTNGAGRVEPRAGDDLVCRTGLTTRFLSVSDGPGSDVYDFRGTTRPGGVTLVGGDDRVIGGPGVDHVRLAGSGRVRLTLGEGADTVNVVPSSWRGRRDEISLGAGADRVRLALGKGVGPVLTAGAGDDYLTVFGRSSSRWSIDAAAERIDAGATKGVVRLSGFDTYYLLAMRVPVLRFVGTERAERLWMVRRTGAVNLGVEAPPLPRREVDLRTGGGDDWVFIGSNDVGALDAGEGVDALHDVAATFDSGADADLGAGEIRVDRPGAETDLLRVAGVDDVTMTGFFPLLLAGNEGDNVLTAASCTDPQTVEGRGGDDHLALVGTTYNIVGCQEAGEEDSPGTLRGGEGDDVLLGDHNDDTLSGEEGVDTVDGAGGEDLCSGEVVTSCEGIAPRAHAVW